MLGLSTRAFTNTNQLHFDITDELKGIELQAIILPTNNQGNELGFFTGAELALLPKINLSTPLEDGEDFSKW